MRKMFNMAAILLLPLFITACWESQEEPESTMELAEDVILMDALGGDKIVRVNSNTRWKLNTEQRDSVMIPTWYVGSAAGTIGYGSQDMAITVSHNEVFENGQFQPRETVLTVEVFDVHSEPVVRTLTIRQEADEYRIALDREEETVRAAAGSLSVTVEAMGPWKVVAPEGITYSVIDNTCTIRYPRNTSEEREFIIMFAITESPYPSATLTLIQEEGEPDPDPDPDPDPES